MLICKFDKEVILRIKANINKTLINIYSIYLFKSYLPKTVVK